MYFPVDPGSNRAVNPAQVAGSTITYMRRYALAAMLGIVADEDADGEQPQAKPQPAAQPQRQPAPAQAPPTDKLYGDGSFVAPAAVESYDAYLAAHNGNAPENVHNLRNWYKSHKASPVNNELFPLQPEPQAGAFSE